MKRQSLSQATRRWRFAHVMFWSVYAVVVMFIVPRFYHSAGFDGWSVGAKTALALAPVAPVALWALVFARFLGGSPDDLASSFVVRASAAAGAVVALGLFAQGWIDLIAGPGVWPRLVFQGLDFTPWTYVALYFLVWTLERTRLRVAATR